MNIIRTNPLRTLLFFSLLTTIVWSSSCKKSETGFIDEEKPERGYLAPGFMLNDKNGNPVSLDEFRGKVVLLEFWASWCGYCTNAIPDLQDIYNTYGTNDFELIGISIDENTQNWLTKIVEENIEYIQLNDPEGFDAEIISKYKVSSIPAYFLINETGYITHIPNSADEAGEILQSLFN